ncbi:LLM class flavin-dependent oxidoreductase [Microbacterium sp. No. 7]|uniref:LLM class flavin-dependent oxidoreductase n=1 Tax=Microbacterium sp. No. 7 TaxID=1714373 RepID=UPI0006CF8279|nr:LLM class flavin-dependent oxidoreductase [Microbacterium sp. No. 7]ALJ19151.1 hypothetical protein AOA12_04230 [Microbacterium sp. No. 7]
MSRHPFAIAVELDGAGSHPGARPASDPLSPRRWAALARIAEALGLTAATFADAPVLDGPARLDAVQRAAFVAPHTGGLGLIPVAHVVHSEPFHVTTQLASLDWLSQGRAGWIAAASSSPREAAAFGAPVRTPDEVANELVDAIEVARRLWDSWQDDAVIRDVPTGRYLDADRLHYVDFAGRGYSVKGPLITPRPPQGQLPVLAHGTDAGADVALVSGADEDATASAARDARGRGAALVWAEIEVALDARGVPAAERVRALDAIRAWDRTGRLRHVGDAAGLAALVTRLSAEVDGIRLLPAEVDVDLEELGRALLPPLRRTIGFASPRPGATLRETLGLARPQNRYTAQEGSAA